MAAAHRLWRQNGAALPAAAKVAMLSLLLAALLAAPAAAMPSLPWMASTGSSGSSGGAHHHSVLLPSATHHTATAAAAPSAANAGPGPGARLVAAQVVFRHGARAPLATVFYGNLSWACNETYPNAPAIDQRDSSTGGPPPPPVDADVGRLPGGCLFGTLTQRGYQMGVDLGAELRGRYVEELGLLSPQRHDSTSGGSSSGGRSGGSNGSSVSEVFAFTTMYRRTIATLRGVLAGLYPDAGPAPFPVNTTDERHAFAYPSPRACGALAPIIKELTKRADAAEASAPQGPVDRVRTALGLPGDWDPPFPWYRLRDVLSCMLAEERRPEGLSDDIWTAIQDRALGWETSIYSPGPWNCPAGDEAACHNMLRLSIGPLLWRLIGNMEQHVEADAQAAAAAAAAAAASEPKPAAFVPTDGQRSGSGGECGASEAAQHARSTVHQQRTSQQLPRLWLYSAHDTTVMPLLSALGYQTPQWAPFTAHIDLQLWIAPAEAAAHGGGGAPKHSSSSGGAAGGGTPWVRILYNGKPLELAAKQPGSGHAASEPGGKQPHGGAGAPHGPHHWRRSMQEQPEHLQPLLLEDPHGRGGHAHADGGSHPQQQQQQQQQQQHAGHAGSGSDSSGGWIELSELKRRLQPFSMTDDAKEDACWKPDG